MSMIILPILELLCTVIGLYKWVVVFAILANWGMVLGFFKTYNALTAQILDALHQVTEPVLAPIRRILPTIAGVDLSPIVLFLGLNFLLSILKRMISMGAH